MTVPLTDDLARAADGLIDANRPPSHDELTRLFSRFRLDAADPGTTFGKQKRTRAVFNYCLENDPTAGGRLLEALIGQVRGAGGFAPSSANFIGPETIANLRRGLELLGFSVDDEGVVHPRILDDLPQVEQRAALATYVRRIRRGSTDAPLVTGSGKDLIEATARHVLVERTGQFNPKMPFAGTLLSAYTELGLATPPADLIQGKGLDPNPSAQMQQALFMLGVAVNRLRNQEGIGHGRPFLPQVTDRQAKLAVQAMALVSEMLLDHL